MNIERLNSIYKDIRIADKSDIDNIKQLTVDFPFYSLPYVILSKYYYQTEHYKFEDMLRQAAMRVKDRKVLYNYIHETSVVEAEKIETKPESLEEKLSSVEDFLSDLEIENSNNEDLSTIGQIHITNEPEELAVSEVQLLEETLAEPEEIENIQIEEPSEFTLHGQTEEVVISVQESKAFDPIGEEIETEFSFSHSFSKDNETEESETIQPVEMVQLIENGLDQNENSDTSEEGEKEEESSGGEELRQIVDDNLRKYPIYSLETHFRESDDEIPVDEQEAEEEEDPGKDFFAWLNSPKNRQKQEVAIQKPQEIEKEEVDETYEKIKTNVNLDLIEKFIQSNPQITRQKKEFFSAENMAKKSEVNDLEIVTETLANIYYEQGNYDLAVKAYEKLSLQNPSKQTYFADLIEKINKERK